MIRTLVLDWSGTLADDIAPVLRATNRIFADYGRAPMDREEFLESFRLPYTDWYRDVLPQADIADLPALYLKYFETQPGEVYALDGAMDFLEAARASGCRIVLCTAVPEPQWTPQAQALGMLGYFDVLHCHAVDKHDTVKVIVEEEGIPAEEIAYVGDMRHDIDAGNSVGMFTIATLTGYETAEKLLTSKPDMLVPNLSGLARLLFAQDANGAMQRPVATSGALILKEEKALMVRTHKWSNTWGIPGGKIDRGETAIEALHREIQEETGLVITDPVFVVAQDCIDPKEFYKDAHFLLFNYVAQWVSGEVELNYEAEEFRWATWNEAQALELNKPTQILLEEARARGLWGAN